MQILAENKTVKEYLGITQKYHNQVLQKQNRFYLIKIQKITNISQTLKKNIRQAKQPNRTLSKTIKSSNPDISKSNHTNSDPKQKSHNYWEIPPQNKSAQFQITFEVGCRSSSQTKEIYFNTENISNPKQKTKNFYQEKSQQQQEQKQNYNFQNLHIFPFERQEVMTIKLQNSDFPQEYGYALMPLVPFIKMPQTKHEVEVQLVFFNDKKLIRKDIAAVLHINLYFLNEFKGNLIVQPLQANLQRNLAEIGQMSPIIRMFLRQNQFCTERISQGGVRPNWQSTNKFCYFNIPIQSAFDQLFIYLFYNREVTMDEIIGSYKYDLQNEGIYKQGECKSKFIQQEKQKQRKIMKYLQQKSQKNLQHYQKKEKFVEIESISSRHESKLQILKKRRKVIDNTDQAIVTKTQKIQILAQKKRIQMQIHQLQWLYKRVQEKRQNLVQTILHNQKIISSYTPINIVSEETKLIYDDYIKQETQIFQEFQKKCKISHQFVDQDLEQFNRKSMTSLKGELVSQEIRKMLIAEINKFLKFAGQRMHKVQVPLLYTPVNQEGQNYKTVQVGKLSFRYLFLYQFEIPLGQDQQGY